MREWDKVTEWKKRYRDFTVTVKHHTVNSSIDWLGPNRWAVYAYIYPTHALFKNFDGADIYQDAARCLPLHGGPSFLKWHFDADLKPSSVQVGADYNHDGDDEFSLYHTTHDAYQVFLDAEALIQYLLNLEKERV